MLRAPDPLPQPMLRVSERELRDVKRSWKNMLCTYPGMVGDAGELRRTITSFRLPNSWSKHNHVPYMVLILPCEIVRPKSQPIQTGEISAAAGNHQQR